jgi:thymidylate kinase
MMKKIVLTGGPCSGKTTVLEAISQRFIGKVSVAPEAATHILKSGYPVPGRDVEWSEEWQAAFQAKVLEMQVEIEFAYELMADGKFKLLICDRGTLDGAAYTPGGLTEFCRRFNLNRRRELAKYTLVIHLQSLAAAEPERYGKLNNDLRFESLHRACELEKATDAAWAEHPHRIFIPGRKRIEEKIEEVSGIIQTQLGLSG